MCNYSFRSSITIWNFDDESESSLIIRKCDFETKESPQTYEAINKWLTLIENKKGDRIEVCPKCGGFMRAHPRFSIYDSEDYSCKICGAFYSFGGTIGFEDIQRIESEINDIIAHSLPKNKLKNLILDFCKTLSVMENQQAVLFNNHVFFLKEMEEVYRLKKIVRLP